MNIELRKLTIADYNDLRESMQQAYVDSGSGVWSKAKIQNLIDIFPQGQMCITVDEKVVACSLSIIVDYDIFGDNHTYEDITGKYSFSTHTASGNVLYGIEVFVHPEYRGLRLARRLYEARKELCETLNLESIIAGTYFFE